MSWRTLPPQRRSSYFLVLPLLLHFNLHLSDLRRMPVVTFGFSAAARDESGKGFVAGAGQASNSIEIQITKLYNVEGFYICIQCLNRLGYS